ncbi:hypothetical protein [Lacticaseibacillus kribbianus]|uniref:hypothetical protein n=1 Tax=Lacticaseibacillus kribbianus TaxID=2926292 RepID=UPI001CD2C6C7|nr:hypothetical protein [Lacticaseibacillus kribbianus]
MRDILKLYWRRYRVAILALLAVVALNAGYVATQQVAEFHGAQAGAISRKAYDKEAAKAKAKAKHDKYVSYDRFMTDTLSVYQDELAPSAHTPMLPSVGDGSLGVNVIYAMTAFVFGLIIAGWDHFGRFDRFVLGTRFARRRVYWTRLGLGGAAVVASILLSQVVLVGGLYLGIPAKYINVSGLQTFGIILYTSALALAAFVIAFTLAMFAGRLWQVGLVSVALLWTFDGVICNYQGLYAQVMHHVSYNSFAGALATPGPTYWPTLVVMLGLAALIACAGAWGFARLSLEYDAAVLVRPLQAVFIALVLLYAFGIDISWSHYGYFEFANSLHLSLITAVLCLLWWFWPRLVAHFRRLRLARG